MVRVSTLWLLLSLTLTIGVALIVWWLVDVVRAWVSGGHTTPDGPGPSAVGEEAGPCQRGEHER